MDYQDMSDMITATIDLGDIQDFLPIGRWDVCQEHYWKQMGRFTLNFRICLFGVIWYKEQSLK